MRQILYFTSIIVIYLLIYACSAGENDYIEPKAATSGKGGSMARFTVNKNTLYTVDNQNLKIFDITDADAPVYVKNIPLQSGVETIFPFKDHLFIGTQYGMYVYNITNPQNPNFISMYYHIVSCDPVVVDDKYAYITLNTISQWCGRYINELQILDISNLASPQYLIAYPMSGPRGLGIDGNRLFVCDAGIKVFDATNVMQLKQLNHFNIPAYDVIPINGNLLVIGEDGFYQYDYTGNQMILLSKISITK